MEHNLKKKTVGQNLKTLMNEFSLTHKSSHIDFKKTLFAGTRQCSAFPGHVKVVFSSCKHVQ